MHAESPPLVLCQTNNLMNNTANCGSVRNTNALDMAASPHTARSA
jgi:hypothetical protein